MNITNLTKTTISFIGRSGLPYEIKPLGTLTLPEKDVADNIISNLVDQNVISVSGWIADAPQVTLTNMIAGEDRVKNVLATRNSVTSYILVPAGTTDKVLAGSGTGAVKDTINRLVITVTNDTTSNVVLTDGTGGAGYISSYTLFPTGMGIGTYVYDLGDLPSINGAWKITTGAGASVIVTGMFS